MDWEIGKVKELAEIVSKYDLNEIKISEGDTQITIKKSPAVIQAVQPYAMNQAPAIPNLSIQSKPSTDFRHIAEMKAIQDELEKTKIADSYQEKNNKVDSDLKTIKQEGTYVKSPIAGIFYRQSQPGNPPYFEVGQTVKKGQTVCLVEAMKMINEVTAPCDGVVKEFLAENEQFVEYGAPLVLIEEE